MAVTSEPDNTPLPGTVFSPGQVRVLKIAVIAMGILLVGGFALVLATIVYQASKGGPDNVAAPLTGAEVELALPADATVTALALDGDRLALHFKSSAGHEVAVIDLNTGKVLSRIRLKSQ